jgi:glycosyltransferase involved in cell wall biosynthesis
MVWLADLPSSEARVSELAPLLTVCVCTRNRPEALDRALRSVLENAPGASMVVSDDGDNEAAKEIVQRFPNCSWQRGPRRGLGANRNAALAAARTPWVLFLDDDARLGETFLPAASACLEALEPERRARTVLTGRECKNGRLVAPHDVDFLGFQRREYREGDPLHTVVINAALWPRTLFDRVCFDENLRYGSDEVDLSYSALAAGYRIAGCEAAVNFHDPDPRGREGYSEEAQASRLRATTRRYWRLERRRGKALLFTLLAPLQLAAALLRRDGIRGALTCATVLRRWLLPG